jgi:hypothetical protein
VGAAACAHAQRVFEEQKKKKRKEKKKEEEEGEREARRAEKRGHRSPPPLLPLTRSLGRGRPPVAVTPGFFPVSHPPTLERIKARSEALPGAAMRR